MTHFLPDQGCPDWSSWCWCDGSRWVRSCQTQLKILRGQNFNEVFPEVPHQSPFLLLKTGLKVVDTIALPVLLCLSAMKVSLRSHE